MALTLKPLKPKPGDGMAVKKEEVSVKDVQILHQGTQIILPVINGKPMSCDEGIEWLRRKREEDERDVGVHHEFPYSPLDGAVAFHKALAEIYGFSQLVPTPGFWGPTPPTMISVPVGLTDKVQVPWGRVQIPGIEGFMETSYQPEPTPRFVINGKVKQKHKHNVLEICTKTEQILKNNSIYKKQAIKISFEWQREGINFSPTQHCPQYWDLSGVHVDDLIFGDEVMNALEIGLFTPIEQAVEMRKYQIPLKRGVLLYGVFGVGKSLTANVTAQKAIKNGFTFVYLDSVLDLRKGLQFAAQYAPSILFAEDIDKAMNENEDRSYSVNEVLNQMDGVDTKGAEVLTVFTTNRVKDIDPAILRMGRLDTLIEVKEPDAAAAIRLVKLYGRGLLSENTDYVRVGKALAGQIPAFIREVTERAKIAAIRRQAKAGSLAEGIAGHVLEEDLLASAAAMQTHAEMLKPKDAELQGSPELLVRVPANHSAAAKKVLKDLAVDNLVAKR